MKCDIATPSGSIELDDGVLAPHREALGDTRETPPVRLFFAALHLVMRDSYANVRHAEDTPGTPEEIALHVDWQATMALRARVDSLGFGIAEAMDTAQRFQIGWRGASELIARCGELHPANGFVAGAGVDHLTEVRGERDLVEGVVFQAQAIQAAGGIPILLPLVPLAREQVGEEAYVRVYGEILARLDGPLFLHWLGAMFLPELAGYFPGNSFTRIMALEPEKLRGAKLSLLDRELELRVRAELLVRDQILLTGDDFNFAGLVAGGPARRTTRIGRRDVPVGEFSHALLGIFDGIAEPAALALECLARGDEDRYRTLMEPCEVLARHVFEPPTRQYKAGLAFLSWLNGAQENRMLVNHEERARSLEHYVETARLASAAGVLRDAELAERRLAQMLEGQG